MSKNGEITGIFDFENAMKGDKLAEIAQSKYWFRFRLEEYANFKYFLRSYGLKPSKKEQKIIRGYCLLHTLAVTRTIWDKQPRLSWIIKKHKKIWDEFIADKTL